MVEKIADKVRSCRSFCCCRSASHARLQENNQMRDDTEWYNQRGYQAERQGKYSGQHVIGIQQHKAKSRHAQYLLVPAGGEGRYHRNMFFLRP
jgi:hypothetical protein